MSIKCKNEIEKNILDETKMVENGSRPKFVKKLKNDPGEERAQHWE